MLGYYCPNCDKELKEWAVGIFGCEDCGSTFADEDSEGMILEEMFGGVADD